jgi:SNF2 family DNA or RNA helicase
VEYPVQDIYAMMKAFNSFDVYRNSENKFIVKTYRAGLLNELKNLGAELVLSDNFEIFWNQMTTFSTTEDVQLPTIKAELREYQTKGFHWLWFMYKYGLNGILADDMGLGKTLQALTLLQKAKDIDGPMPTLVICPTSVVFNWESEIQKFTPELTCLKLSGVERKQFFKEIPQYDIVITSYALVRRDIEKLKKVNFRYVILDESQNIKNALSQTAQAVKKLNAQHKMALSGTPIENYGQYLIFLCQDSCSVFLNSITVMLIQLWNVVTRQLKDD